MPVHSTVRAAIAAAALMLMAGGAAAADPLIVQLDHGKVRGKFINHGAVRAFLGIPYAAPPLGPKRWAAPQPPSSWTGIKDAVQYGHRCMQGRVFSDIQFQDESESEDCLVLNVFVPAEARAGAKLPVMFWIHGGGYSAGAAYWTNFAKTGDPNGPGLPSWPSYAGSDAVLHLDDPISVRSDEHRARYEFLLQADASP
jgi:para-nitrobenzyl esterase